MGTYFHTVNFSWDIYRKKSSMQLKGEGNLAHEIIESLVNDRDRRDEIVALAKSLLDLALNNDFLDAFDRARVIGMICWRHGLEPPDEIKSLIM